MRRLTSNALALLAVGVTLIALSVPGSATVAPARPDHVTVEGTWTDPGPTIDSITPDGPAYIVALHGNTTASGPFAGVSAYSFTLRYDPTTGRFHGPGQETFTASLDGAGSGTVTFAEQFRLAPDGSTSVTGVVVGGDGIFTGAHGALHFVGATEPGSSTSAGTFRLVLELHA